MGSTDTGGSGLDGYDVLRDGGLIGTTTAAAFAVPKLSPACTSSPSWRATRPATARPPHLRWWSPSRTPADARHVTAPRAP
ncbi:hypothetical protein [Paractinoplanes durhamensis]|uniref:hypothetical protein n=1 Tax=Paractinoplanes durhamensis TaxID=113563 RepID=UPI0036405FD1